MILLFSLHLFRKDAREGDGQVLLRYGGMDF